MVDVIVMPKRTAPLGPGSETKYGTVRDVVFIGGDKFYVMLVSCGPSQTIPASAVEDIID